MLRGTEKWVTYFVLTIVFIFGIVFLAKQIGVTTDLKQSMAHAKAAGLAAGDLSKITHLHNASAKVFFLSFFALCLLLIGIIIIMKGIQRAYDISEVKEKVRHHLKSTTPGVVMVVLASFLLAFCTYRSSHIETVYSSRLIDYNNFKLAMQGPKNSIEGTLTPHVDTSALGKLKDKTKNIITDVPDIPKKVANKFDKKSKEKPVVASDKKTEKKQGKLTVAKKESSLAANKKKSQQEKETTNAAVATKDDVKKSAEIIAPSYHPASDEKNDKTALQNTPPPKTANSGSSTSSITRTDITWAEQFQKKVTVYGYVPNPAEEERYNRIAAYLEQVGENPNLELYWAYNFLQKTKRGYEPKPGEMQRYEEIIARNIHTTSSGNRVPSEL